MILYLIENSTKEYIKYSMSYFETVEAESALSAIQFLLGLNTYAQYTVQGFVSSDLTCNEIKRLDIFFFLQFL